MEKPWLSDPFLTRVHFSQKTQKSFDSLRFYLFIWERARVRWGAEGEAGSMHREPNVGFDPGSPGSRPGPKASAKPPRHPGIPVLLFIALLSHKSASCLGCVGSTWMVIGLFHIMGSHLFVGWSRRFQMWNKIYFIVCIIFSRSLDWACSDGGGKIPSEKIETLRPFEAWSWDWHTITLGPRYSSNQVTGRFFIIVHLFYY